jgi:hypothetical protein
MSPRFATPPLVWQILTLLSLVWTVAFTAPYLLKMALYPRKVRPPTALQPCAAHSPRRSPLSARRSPGAPLRTLFPAPHPRFAPSGCTPP